MSIQEITKGRRRPALFPIAFTGLCVLYAAFMLAYADGVSGRTRKNGSNGCNCHGNSPTAGVVVTIAGPETLRVNQAGSYSVRITGGPAVGAGTDIAASAGTLAPVSAGLKLSGSDLTHSETATFTGGAATFQFTYTAPATPGVQTLYADGISVNFTGGTGGDQWNFAPNKTVTVVSGLTAVGDQDASAPSAHALAQNYPNPFNPTTEIRFTIADVRFVSLKVYNTLGEEVAELAGKEMAPGSYTIPWDATGMPSGVYYYRLAAGAFIDVKKMALIQ